LTWYKFGYYRTIIRPTAYFMTFGNKIKHIVRIRRSCDEIHSFRSALLRFIRASVAMVCGSLWVARCTTSFRSASFRGHRATHGYTKYFAPKFFKFCLKILRIAADHCQTYFFWILKRICIFHHQFDRKIIELEKIIRNFKKEGGSLLFQSNFF